MRNCSVLVVDDDPVIVATIGEILALEGFPILTAANGMEALLTVEREHPRVVLVDLGMPVIDGWDFARVLTGSHSNPAPDPKIIVMTAARDGKRHAEQIGAEGYLSKPFDLDQLLSQVTRLAAA